MVGLVQVATRSPPIDGEVAGEHVDEALWLHLLDICSGGKCLLAAGHDDAAHGGVGFQLVDGDLDFAEHTERKRIEHLRAIQRDDADRAFALNDEVFVAAHVPSRGFFAEAARIGGPAQFARSGDGVQAINIRAAEAMVSKPPNAMKILPTREVLSQVVLLSVATSGAGVSMVAFASVSGGLSLLMARSRSLSWSAATSCALLAPESGDVVAGCSCWPPIWPSAPPACDDML